MQFMTRKGGAEYNKVCTLIYYIIGFIEKLSISSLRSNLDD